jgi:hypothetical protein
LKSFIHTNLIPRENERIIDPLAVVEGVGVLLKRSIATQPPSGEPRIGI